MDWKNLKVGDKFIRVVDEFDGYSEDLCTVKEIYPDHLIVECDFTDHLWVDEDTEIKPLEVTEELERDL